MVSIRVGESWTRGDNEEWANYLEQLEQFQENPPGEETAPLLPVGSHPMQRTTNRSTVGPSASGAVFAGLSDNIHGAHLPP